MFPRQAPNCDFVRFSCKTAAGIIQIGFIRMSVFDRMYATQTSHTCLFLPAPTAHGGEFVDRTNAAQGSGCRPDKFLERRGAALH